ncbi:MAG: phosphonate C-P lyase system protein PhnL [Candidatus Methylopumilus sp.]|nr:phosphonate C-P lyase system protein PhnL [Candidatus Methylopumilus sp.]
MITPVLRLTSVSKQFTLHHQNGLTLPVLNDVNFEVAAGECVVLDGASGMGKSTLLKLIYANYRVSTGSIQYIGRDGEPLELTTATARELIAVRRHHIGYVSQFLRVIPRISTLDLVAEPLLSELGYDEQAVKQARTLASDWLTRLRIPERLWGLAPATFSGGEQQRVNIARSMIKPRSLLLLDEPTASLDPQNTQTVVSLIHEAIAAGAAAVGIFHDQAVGNQLATRRIDMTNFRSITCAAQ